jgi:hypothetical protein
MANLYRHRTAIRGLTGGDGVATMYFASPTDVLPAVQNLWIDLVNLMPVNVVVQTEPGGDVINEANGQLVSSWSDSPQGPLSGNSAQPYPAPAGFVLGWRTDTILDGTRLQGRTFVVPVTSAFYATDGTILTSVVEGIQVNIDTFLAALGTAFVIWHRPFEGAPAVPPTSTKPGKAARPAHDGGHGIVTSGSVKDRVAILRSRRS